VEIKIADHGEVLVKGPMLLKEYYNRPDATAESLNEDGYFMTGDAGFIDADGHLNIIDRAKDVGKLANGAMFAPNYIENKLKFSSISRKWSASATTGTGYAPSSTLTSARSATGPSAATFPIRLYRSGGKPQVYELIRTCVGEVNAILAQDGVMADSQIHRFLILHKELDPDDDELTRTRKVRRDFVAKKYQALIDALYGGQVRNSSKPRSSLKTAARQGRGRSANHGR